MAAQYTEVTLQDMETFLKRAFHALRPRQGTQNREYYYDLELSDAVVIRVWSSVQQQSGSGAGVGEDAIRVQLMGAKTKRPLMKGRAPIVKRTQGWKSSLQNRIEEMIETYEEKHEYWDDRGVVPAQSAPQPSEAPAAPLVNAPISRPSGPGPRGPSDAQVNFIRKMMMAPRAESRFEGNGIFKAFPKLQWPFDETNIRSFSLMEASRIIDYMKAALGWGRTSSEAPEEPYSYRR